MARRTQGHQVAEQRADIGLVGLAVMGQNLVLNMVDHGARVAVQNRTTSKMEDFVADAPEQVVGCVELSDLVETLATPRRIMLMVQAGPAVDAVLDDLVPLLDEGDLVIDGGNSHFEDTIRRTQRLEERGLRYLGTGVSGGEEGARHGPSIMPGGTRQAWEMVGELLQAIAADADDGAPCCDYLGPDGAGHYVKMVHNGIEYGDMQVIAEAYHLLSATGRSNDEMAAIFRGWGDGVLDSFLIDITAEILEYTDDGGEHVIDHILDAAGQKGTGKWTAISSLDLGQPVTLVAEAVYARITSAFKEQRQHAAEILAGPDQRIDPDDLDLDDLRDALYGAKIVSYAQGFVLLRAASAEHDWDLDLGRTASLWRAGCIIRAAFLDDVTAAFDRDADLQNLLLDEFFAEAIQEAQAGWRRVVATAVGAGIPVPAYASALAWFDAIRTPRLPANMIQAQRDYFGAHTYERVDRDRGEFFHTDWAGLGDDGVTAGSYTA